MRFTGGDSTHLFSGANENTVISTNADGTFSYTFTERYASIPIVNATPIKAGVGVTKALSVTLDPVTLTGCSGQLFGYQAQPVLLNLTGGSANVNVMVPLSSPVSVQLMVLGEGA